MRTYQYTCPSGSHFDPVKNLCVEGNCPATTPSTPVLSTTTVPTTSISPTTTAAPTTVAPFQCGVTQGTFPEPTNCVKYNRCILIAGVMRVYQYTCPSGSYFDQTKNLCVIGTCPSTPSPTTVLPTTTTLATTSTTPAMPTTVAPFQCGDTEGTFPEPTDCTKYNRCILIAGALRLYQYTCPSASYFDPVKNLCVLGNC